MRDQTTQPSLLSRVRNPEDEAAWREFDAKYRDLILRYCRARAIQVNDAEDVRQIAMTNLAKRLREFAYDPSRGKFRSYLGQVVRSAIRQHFTWKCRAPANVQPPSPIEGDSRDIIREKHRPRGAQRALDTHVLATVDAADNGTDEIWEQEWMRHHFRIAMGAVRTTFEERSLAMFDRLLAGDAVAEVARDFETTEQAVHKVKQRIRNRLKELIEEQVRLEDI